MRDFRAYCPTDAATSAAGNRSQHVAHGTRDQQCAKGVSFDSLAHFAGSAFQLIDGFAVHVLHLAFGLAGITTRLSMMIARRRPQLLFNFASQVLGSAFNSVQIDHGVYS